MSLQCQYVVDLHRDENPVKNRCRHNIACPLGCVLCSVKFTKIHSMTKLHFSFLVLVIFQVTSLVPGFTTLSDLVFRVSYGFVYQNVHRLLFYGRQGRIWCFCSSLKNLVFLFLYFSRTH